MTLSQDTLEKLHEKYLETQMQQQLATGTERFRINANGTINIGGLEVPTVNLDEGAWNVPISQLVDLWTVRHGSKWVSEDELDDFYEVASTRLRQLNKLEQHYVNGKDVFRIVE